MVLQRLTGQLPPWARLSHPVLRYELGKTPKLSTRARYLRAFAVVLLALLLLAGGYLIATGLLTRPAGQNLTESVNAVVFWPLLTVQLLMRLIALSLTSNAVSEEIRRQNWDNMRATQHGAELVLRTRWAAVFYRMRGLLGVVLLIRLLLIIGILWDLTAFQGRYLDLLINGIVPDVPLAAGVLLLSLLMTAALLLPITALGFDAALGLLLSTFVYQRTYSALIQLLLTLIRVGIVALLLIGVTQFTNGELPLVEWQSWLLVGGFGALGDWGLAFLNLGYYGEIWATVPYGILLGLGLLAFALVQAVLTDQILMLAVRRAEKKG